MHVVAEQEWIDTEFSGSDFGDERLNRRFILTTKRLVSSPESTRFRNLDEFASAHDTDFAYDLPGVARFRVNMLRDRMVVGAVLRQIPDRILSADELGLSPAIRKLCELQKVLVIVTGPAGPSKSTTLASMIDLINDSRSDHILTIEDPIEFVHPQKRCLINQREVHRHTQSFSRALRAALREDPDIILIGELTEELR